MDLNDNVPITFKGDGGKDVPYWAAGVMGRTTPPSVAYCLLNAGAAMFFMNNTMVPMLKAQAETIAALAANASGVDVQPILDAIKAKIDAIEITVAVTDPAPAAG